MLRMTHDEFYRDMCNPAQDSRDFAGELRPPRTDERGHEGCAHTPVDDLRHRNQESNRGLQP
jgi:hypothetical protein